MQNGWAGDLRSGAGAGAGASCGSHGGTEARRHGGRVMKNEKWKVQNEKWMGG